MKNRSTFQHRSAIAAASSLFLLVACGGQDEAGTTDGSALNDRSALLASTQLDGDIDSSPGADRDPERFDDPKEAPADPGQASNGVGVPSAPAPAPAPAPASAAKPRVAATMLSGLWTSQARGVAAKFGFVVMGAPYTSPSTLQSWINDVRKANPSIILGRYSNAVEADFTPEADRSTYDIDRAVVANNWWLTSAAGSKAQWTTAYDTYVVNLTRSGAKDSSGRHYTEWLGDYVANSVNAVTGIDYVYQDNVWYTPRPYKGYFDFMRNGSDQYAKAPEIQAAWRMGTTDYVARLRSKVPGVKVMGNADNDLSYPEYKGKYDGAFLECGFGKSWSYYERLGWNRMMAEYRAQLANTISKKDTILQGCGPNGLNLTMLRFGLASALLENGWFAYKITGETAPYVADEYNANLGTPSEVPPTAATASGIWMRQYSNGIVLVNPGTTTASVNIGSGYKRLTGTQDPVTNNGLPVSTVTLEPNRGIIVVKQ